jgi:hypothetical protein
MKYNFFKNFITILLLSQFCQSAKFKLTNGDDLYIFAPLGKDCAFWVNGEITNSVIAEFDNQKGFLSFPGHSILKDKVELINNDDYPRAVLELLSRWKCNAGCSWTIHYAKEITTNQCVTVSTFTLKNDMSCRITRLPMAGWVGDGCDYNDHYVMQNVRSGYQEIIRLALNMSIDSFVATVYRYFPHQRRHY